MGAVSAADEEGDPMGVVLFRRDVNFRDEHY